MHWRLFVFGALSEEYQRHIRGIPYFQISRPESIPYLPTYQAEVKIV